MGLEASLIGFAVTRLPDPSWGSPKIARAVGRNGDPWGVLSVLRETPWEGLFPMIPSSTFDMALRGHATPLMKILGPPPKALAKRIPEEYRLCRLRNECVNAAPTCVPGSKMPLCWEAEKLELPASEVASKVAAFWKEGIHVVIIVPEDV
jgi:hypothetical protein